MQDPGGDDRNGKVCGEQGGLGGRTLSMWCLTERILLLLRIFLHIQFSSGDALHQDELKKADITYACKPKNKENLK